MAISFRLSEAEQAYLARLARLSIESELTGRWETLPPEPECKEATAGSESTPGTLRRALGSFVTLTLQGQLRGCIGAVQGQEPLYQNVWRMARAAAFEDPRFPPLTLHEWGKAELHITVLDELVPCPDPTAIEVGRHGLALQYMGRSGVFLPQVPVEQGWDQRAYLDNLCRKACVPRGSWSAPGARLFWFEALAFPG